MTAASSGAQVEECLAVIEVQMLDLSDRPYAPTGRASRTLDLVSHLADVITGNGEVLQYILLRVLLRHGAGSLMSSASIGESTLQVEYPLPLSVSAVAIGAKR